MPTEPVTRGGAILQKPPLVLVCFWIWDGIRATEANVSRKSHRWWYCGRTSNQRDSLVYSGDRVAHNPYCEASPVLARVPLVEESTLPSVEWSRASGNQLHTLSDCPGR